MSRPLISVIIPVYNPGKHLYKCLESIINQTYDNLEIVLVNDGSTDESAEICLNYAQQDKRIKYIYQENKGVSRARNVGIDNSSGDYYSFIDSDDYLELDTYEYLVDLIQEHQVDAVNYEYYITYKDNEVTHRIKDESYGYFERAKAQYQLVYNVAFAWNKLFSREIIEEIKFNEEILRGEDSLFARMAFDRANSVWFDSRPLIHYVQSEESAVRGKFRVSQLTALELYDIYYPFYQEKYPELLNKFASNMASLLISLYYDMWSDNVEYTKEQGKVYDTYCKYYMDAMGGSDLGLKQKVKQRIFRYAPKLFCELHRLSLKRV